MLGVEELHKRVLYPTVLVRTEEAGGSGTVIGSIERDGEWFSYILTNHHVIANAIGTTKQFDPLVGREVDREVRSPVDVGFYEYRRLSILDRIDSRRADIVAYDQPGDMALLELISAHSPEHIATMLPEDQIKSVRMMMPLIACGCSLGHKPVTSMGYITSLDERIENLSYWMANTPTIFGNSGGGQFLADTGEFVGIPSRLDVILLGFGAQAITHLSYFIPIARIYDMLQTWEYQFIYDDEYTYDDCEKRRKEKQDNLQRDWERRWRRQREQAIGGGVNEEETTETGNLGQYVLNAIEKRKKGE